MPMVCLAQPRRRLATDVASLLAARAEKAKATFPRPAAGVLKPVVRGQTVKYNSKQRLGRGFTLEELKVRDGSCTASSMAASITCRRRRRLTAIAHCA